MDSAQIKQNLNSNITNYAKVYSHIYSSHLGLRYFRKSVRIFQEVCKYPENQEIYGSAAFCLVYFPKRNFTSSSQNLIKSRYYIILMMQNLPWTLCFVRNILPFFKFIDKCSKIVCNQKACFIWNKYEMLQ